MRKNVNMRKNLIYTVCSVIIVSSIIYLYFACNDFFSTDQVERKTVYSNMKAKKAKPKKLGKTQGKFYKSKKDDKMYAVFKRYKDSSKEKRLLFVFKKGSFLNDGKIMMNITKELKIQKPGVIFHDTTDIDTLVKPQESILYNGTIIHSSHDDNSLLEQKFK